MNHFSHSVVRWEYVAFLYRLADNTVQRFDGTRRVNGFMDVSWVAEERIEVFPRVYANFY
ncbi:hypothetical protein DZS_51900 [Dickeya ananatis]